MRDQSVGADSIARIELRFPGELFPQFLLGVGEFVRHDDFGGQQQVARLAEDAPAHPEFLAAGGAGRDLDVHLAVERGHGDLRAQQVLFQPGVEGADRA